jgi:hypothetical protein
VKRGKRLFSLLLTLALLMQCLSGVTLVNAAEADAHGSVTTKTENGQTIITVTPESGYDLCTIHYGDTYIDCDSWTKTATGYTITLSGEVSGIQATFFNTQVWDGSLDVSWYSDDGTTFHLTNPAQLAGLAAIVNGIYNKEITRDMIKGDISVIQDKTSTTGDSEGSFGLNLSTAAYHYGGDDFCGKTVYLDCDMDMGGEAHNYMPIGGQYLMDVTDSATKLGASFNGTFDGQGYSVKNIYCNRYNEGENYGDGASVGLIGRLGVHDNDDASLRAYQPTVRNVVVYGYFYARRSVGGIVGKIGKTQYNNSPSVGYGALIENCANYATIQNTDAKGAGGICGSAWNGGIIRNCYNAGAIISSYGGPCGGIVGYNEVTLENCYNIGYVENTASSRYAQAIGSHNGGSYTVKNCYYLANTAANGGYYNAPSGSTVTEMTSSEMQSAAFVTALNNGGRAFVQDTKHTNNGYPILRCTLHEGEGTVSSISFDTSSMKTDYLLGESVDLSGLVITANYTDGTTQQVTQYTVTAGSDSYTVDGSYENGKILLTQDKLTDGKITVTVSGSFGGKTFSQNYILNVETNVTLTSIGVTGFTHRTYVAGETWDFSGATVTVSYEAKGSYGAQTVTDYTVTANQQNADGTIAYGATTLTVSYTMGGVTKETTLNIRVVASQPSQVNDVYQIASAEDLIWFAAQVNEQGRNTISAKLTADVDCSSLALTPIGTESKKAYAGTFDGNGHSITLGSFCSDTLGSRTSTIALFAYTKNAKISNLTIRGSISGGTQVAGLIAQDTGYTTVTNCTNGANITATGYGAGITAYVSGPDSKYDSCTNSGTIAAAPSASAGAAGIIGWAADSVTLTNCQNTGAIQDNGASGALGGIVGLVSSGSVTITSAANAGAVTHSTASSYETGGIVGRVESSEKYTTTISQSQNTAQITSASTGVGGIVGGTTNSARLTVTQCRNTGAIQGLYDVGGLVGRNVYTLSYSYNTGAVKSTSKSTSANRGTGGLAGKIAQSSVITGCYNVGAVTAAVNQGGLVGYATVYVTFAQCGYLNNATKAVTANNDSYVTTAPTGSDADTMKTAAFLSTLNGTGNRSYVADSGSSNGGYPILRWQLGANADTATVTNIVCTQNPTKLAYTEGQTFSADGLVLLAKYSDGSSQQISDYTISNTSALTTSDTTITVSGTYGGVQFSFDFTITVTQDKIDLIKVTTAPNWTVYSAGETFRADGMVVEATYASGKTETLTDYTVTPETLTADTQWVTIHAAGQEATQDVTISVCEEMTQENGVYLISSAEQFYLFAAMVNERGQTNVSGKLTTDLTLDSRFQPIGSRESATYTGTLDGDGHTLTVSYDTTKDNVGLIAYAGTSAAVKNLTLAGSIIGGTNVGGFVGYGYDVTIENCRNTAVISGTENVGGIAGYLFDSSSITNCANTGTVKFYNGGTSGLGGILGNASDVTLTNCTNAADISATGKRQIGGILGVTAGATLQNCINNGSITCGAQSGGIVGQSTTGAVNISGCTNNGAINGGTYSDLGGILGSGSGTISASKNYGALTAGTNAGGIAGTMDGTISQCGSYGAITASGNNVGGIAGTMTGTGISNSSSRVSVTGKTQVGGIVGSAACDSIAASYASGTITATSTDTQTGQGLGGIVGYVNHSGTLTLTNCAFTGTLSGQAAQSKGGLVGFAVTSLTLTDSAYTPDLSDVGNMVGTGTKTGAGTRSDNPMSVISDRKNSCGGPVLSWEAPTDHIYNGGAVTTAATCVSAGIMTYTCTTCGETKIESIAATGIHSYNDGTVTTPPTCTATGIKTRTCTVCGATATETLSATGHNYNSGAVTTAATCTTAGVKTYTCTNAGCGATKTESIPALGHTYDSGKVTKAATCTAAGVKTYTCTRCGATKTESIPATGSHSYNAGVVTRAATCTAAGVKTYTCTVCGTARTEAIAATGHSYDSGKVTKAATCTAAGVKTYTCTNCGATKTETIAAITCQHTAFADVAQAAWYHNALDYVLTNHLMSGYGNGKFGPDDNLSRAQMVQILYNREGQPSVSTSSGFTDVVSNAWFSKSITWAAQNGIVGGYGNGKFGPDDNITREQLAVILWRYAGSPQPTQTTLNFSDAGKVSSYAKAALLWANEKGLVNGMGDGTLNPQGQATRSQAAKMLMVFDQLYK